MTLYWLKCKLYTCPYSSKTKQTIDATTVYSFLEGTHHTSCECEALHCTTVRATHQHDGEAVYCYSCQLESKRKEMRLEGEAQIYSSIHLTQPGAKTSFLCFMTVWPEGSHKQRNTLEFQYHGLSLGGSTLLFLMGEKCAQMGLWEFTYGVSTLRSL